ncbi:MAG: SPASM domain-containing protein [Armatimonadota bacterium]
MTTLLVKPVGDRCNLACAHCFYRPGSGTPGAVMAPAILAALTEQALSGGDSPVVFAWQGGEPTLAGIDFYREALSLQRRFARPGQVVANAFQTNGYAIDDEWAAFLSDSHFLVGLSTDGPAEFHDRLRRTPSGGGSHAEAVRAWRTLRHRGCEVNLLCVVHRRNCDQPERVYRHLTDDLGADHLQFIPCLAPEGSDHAFPPGVYGRFLTAVFDLWAAERTRAISVKLFDDLVLFLAGKPMRDCMCSAACDSHLVIERDGSVYPCDFFVTERSLLGNIATDGLTDLRSSAAARTFRERKQTERPVACTECRHLDLCQGGCPWFWRGERDQRRQTLCEDMLLFFDHCRAPMEQMASAIRARWQQSGAAG